MKNLIFLTLLTVVIHGPNNLRGQTPKINAVKLQKSWLYSEGVNSLDTTVAWNSIETETVDHKLLGKKAPELSEFTLDNVGITIGKPGQIQVINFWYVGCLPCHFEIPHFNRLYNLYRHDSTVAIMSLCRDNEERIRSFLSTSSAKDSILVSMASHDSIRYPIIPKAKWEALRYSVWSYPTTFITDQDGVIRYVAEGFTLHADKAYFYKKLRKAIEDIKARKSITVSTEN